MLVAARSSQDFGLLLTCNRERMLEMSFCFRGVRLRRLKCYFDASGPARGPPGRVASIAS
jgi:hypothetical protein